jgi:hypothetical protein
MAKKKSKYKNKQHGKKRLFSIIILSLLIIIGGTFFYISRNFDRILSDKIHTLYKQSEASNYYNLSFDKLRVNLINMSVRIYKVNFEPINTNADFFKKNGSLKVKIGKIVIKEAAIFDFISSNNISVKDFVIEHSKITIYNPSSRFKPFAFITNSNPNDSLQLEASIQHIRLDDTQLEYFGDPKNKIENSFREFSMEIDDLHFNKALTELQFRLSKLVANLRKAHFQSTKAGNFSLERLQFGVSEFQINLVSQQLNIDYQDFFIQLIKPKAITKDSLYTLSSERILIDERQKKLQIVKANIHPNLDNNSFAHHFKYQQLRAEIDIDKIDLANIDYEKLIHREAIIADTVYISGLHADLYKDKNLPLNRKVYPKYLARQIFDIKIPLQLGVAIIKDVNIDFSARQKNGRLSIIDITDIDGQLENLQNKNTNEYLRLTAIGRIHNSIPFDVTILFDYSVDQFSYEGRIFKSDLSSISSVVRSFAPVKIKNGHLKSITFKGYASNTNSRGNMLFLYKDLDLEIENNNKQKEKEIQKFVLSLAANTYIYSNNPVKADHAPRRVDYYVQRDQNKGFLNLLIKSIIQGIKETVIPSKENRKNYRETRKKEKKYRD